MLIHSYSYPDGVHRDWNDELRIPNGCQPHETQGQPEAQSAVKKTASKPLMLSALCGIPTTIRSAVITCGACGSSQWEVPQNVSPLDHSDSLTRIVVSSVFYILNIQYRSVQCI